MKTSTQICDKLYRVLRYLHPYGGRMWDDNIYDACEIIRGAAHAVLDDHMMNGGSK